MFGHSPIEGDKDRRTKIYLDNAAVSASTAQSEYSRFPNFIGDRFTAVTNTISGVKTYDIALKYADKIIPKEGNVLQGSVPRHLNFDDNHFDVAENAGNDTYDVTSTGRILPYLGGSAKAGGLGFANFDSTHFGVADIASNQYNITLPNHASYLLDEKAKVYVNDVQVGSVAAHLNFSTEFTATYDAGTLRHDIALAGTSSTFLPDPTIGHYGIYRWSDNDGSLKEGLFGSFLYEENGDGANMDRSSGDDADGKYVLWSFGGASNDDYIQLTSTNIDNFFTRRDYNPHLYGKLKITSASSFRAFFGFHNNDPLPNNTNDYLGSNSGFGFVYDGLDNANWQIYRNDGDATQDKTSTGVAFSSGTVITFHIYGNSSGWFYQVNGGTAVNITTEVPAAATRMHLTCRVEEIDDGPNVNIYYFYYKDDK